MKLITIALLTLCLHVSARGLSQSISLSVKDADLRSVLKAIEKQTDFVFMVEKQWLQKAKKVTLSVNNLPLTQVLDLCFRDQPLYYKISGKIIAIGPKKNTVKIDEETSNIEQTRQIIDVKGRVVNENNDPVEGVNVIIKGTSIGTITDANGEFFLKGIDENATLSFTSINMESFEVKLKGKPFIDVALQTKITAMQEVVINKGYYTEKKKLATGNVSTIKAKDIQNQPVNNPLLALVGRVPGVTIEQQTGFANSGVVVRVQGRNSIASGLEPLYVIDGVPYSSQPLPVIGTAATVLGGGGNVGGNSPIGGNPLNLINPNDIESIDILKDADATAIYGSRGANGVVLITTKKGKAGQTRVNANFRSGWGNIAKRLDLLNTQQYLSMRRQAYINDGLPVPNQSTTPSNSNYDLTIWDSTRYTDWQDVLFGRTAKYTDAQVSVSGGTTNTQFLVSAGYHKETTVFPGDFADNKGTFQFNINHTSNNQKFRIQTSSVYVYDKNQLPFTDFTNVAIKLAPNAPALYNPDGSLNWEQIAVGAGTVSTWTNPVAQLNNKYTNKASNLIGNLQLSYQLLKKLSLSSRFGYNNIQNDELYINPLSAVRPELMATTNRSATYGNATSNSWIIEPQITYDIVLGKGNMSVLAGTTFQQSTIKSQPVFGTGYTSDLLLQNLQAATTVRALTPTHNVYKYNAIYGRLNYNFKDRYIVNTTARRDGSSRFGSENLFNNFWSVAGSWLFTNENWLSSKLHLLSFGKVRVSYGTSGNDQIGEYGFMNLYNPVTTQVGVPYQAITALAPRGHTNPYLQWEETNKLQFGLDLGFLNDRINFNLNYYRNRSSNLLVSQSLSQITGFTTITKNFEGVLENTGWEFSLQGFLIRKKDFFWTLNFNLTIPVRNGHLLSFPDLDNSFYANIYTVGKSINNTRVYHSIGVDPGTGLYKFLDAKGEATFAPSTLDLIGYRDQNQKLFGGIQNTINYKGLEIDFSIQGVKKKSLLLYGNLPGFFNGTSNSGNQPIWMLDNWQIQGDVKSVQRISASYSNSGLLSSYSNFYSNSDSRLVDASFIRLTNISISWEIPAKWRKITFLKSAKLFMQGQNLLTITKYKGLDPLASGSTDVSLPPLRVITFGSNITF